MTTQTMVTIGPVTESKEKLLEVINCGVNCLRISLAYNNRPNFQILLNIYELTRNFKKKPLILIDIPSSRPRIGNIEDMTITKGEIIYFAPVSITSNILRKEKTIPLKNLEIYTSQLKQGDIFAFLDGRIKFQIEKITDNYSFIGRSLSEKGILKKNNAINFYNPQISHRIIGNDEIVFLEKLREHNIYVNWLALSMISNSFEIINVKRILGESGFNNIKLMAKIETIRSLENIIDIVNVSDGIMVARGDLGTAVPYEQLPNIQRNLVELSKSNSKVVVVASQMLEYFSDHGSPLRAELSDVALAVQQGADMIMLGKETVYSKYPIETIKLANRIISYESSLLKVKNRN